jgi:hypothetical protein
MIDSPPLQPAQMYLACGLICGRSSFSMTGVRTFRMLLLTVPSLGLVEVACACAKPYPGLDAKGNVNGGSDPPAGMSEVSLSWGSADLCVGPESHRSQ